MPAAVLSSVEHPNLRKRITMTLAKLPCTQAMHPGVCKNGSGKLVHFHAVLVHWDPWSYRKIKKIMERVKGGSTGDVPLTPPTNSIPDYINIGNASLNELGELIFFFLYTWSLSCRTLPPRSISAKLGPLAYITHNKLWCSCNSLEMQKIFIGLQMNCVPQSGKNHEALGWGTYIKPEQNPGVCH